MPDFVKFHKNCAGTTLRIIKVSADKSECIKVKSYNNCLDLMHLIFMALRHLFFAQAQNFSAYPTMDQDIRDFWKENKIS